MLFLLFWGIFDLPMELLKASLVSLSLFLYLQFFQFVEVVVTWELSRLQEGQITQTPTKAGFKLLWNRMRYWGWSALFQFSILFFQLRGQLATNSLFILLEDQADMIPIPCGQCKHPSCLLAFGAVCVEKVSVSKAIIKGHNNFKMLGFMYLLLSTWLISKYWALSTVLIVRFLKT